MINDTSRSKSQAVFPTVGIVTLDHRALASNPSASGEYLPEEILLPLQRMIVVQRRLSERWCARVW